MGSFTRNVGHTKGKENTTIIERENRNPRVSIHVHNIWARSLDT